MEYIFAHDTDLYYIKLNDENYFLTSFLQKILFENLNTLPSFRLRIGFTTFLSFICGKLLFIDSNR